MLSEFKRSNAVGIGLVGCSIDKVDYSEFARRALEQAPTPQPSFLTLVKKRKAVSTEDLLLLEEILRELQTAEDELKRLDRIAARGVSSKWWKAKREPIKAKIKAMLDLEWLWAKEHGIK